MGYEMPKVNNKEDEAKKIAADYHAFADKIYQDKDGVWKSKTTNLPIEDIDNLYKKNDDNSDKRRLPFND